MLLAMAAEKFACRPSRLVGLGDPVLALDFDLAATARLLAAERAAAAGADRAADLDASGPSASAPRVREIEW